MKPYKIFKHALRNFGGNNLIGSLTNSLASLGIRFSLHLSWVEITVHQEILLLYAKENMKMYF